MMNNTLKRTLTAAAVSALLVAPLAHATNGYFKIGSGSKNRGMAGAGIAYGQDAMAAAVNPATLSGIGNRIDAGVEVFKPKRNAVVDATGMDTAAAGIGGGYTSLAGANSEEDSRANAFFIPHFGLSKAWSNRITLGLAVTGNGGMNTRYGDANAGNGNLYSNAFGPVIGNCSDAASCPNGAGLPFPPLNSGFAGLLEANGVPASTLGPNLFTTFTNPNNAPALGVNLAQALIAPTIAYKINDHHSVGFAPVIGYQAFRAYGLGLYQGLSSDPGNVTNNGNDTSWGYGARIGYQGTFGNFSMGATATSKIYMDEFDKYAGLFAEQGDFDIPPTFGVGMAFKATPKLTVAADVSRILYSDVAAISNKGPTADAFFDAFGNALINGSAANLDNGLGKDDGWGFGWDDVWIYKVGVDYAYSHDWTFRAGFNYAEMPYEADQALFNVLAPATVEKHATIGFTRSINSGSEITVTYMHAFRNDVEYTYQGTGQNAAFSFDVENEMYQDSFEVSYGMSF